MVQGAFDSCGITVPAPAWYPEDTMLAQDIKVSENLDGSVVLCEFVCGDDYFFIEAQQYIKTDRIAKYTIEKDHLTVEEYPSNDRLFYIMFNQSNICAVHSNSQYLITINGRLSLEDLKCIIDSIGE